MPTTLSKKQKFAIGGTFGLIASALILFLIIRASKDESQDGKTGKSDDKSKNKRQRIISEQEKLVETLFPGDEAARKWIRESGSRVVDCPEFETFFSESYRAGKKEELGKLLKATSEMLLEQANKLEARGNYKKSEKTLVNAAICKSLAGKIDIPDFSARALLQYFGVFEDLLIYESEEFALCRRERHVHFSDVERGKLFELHLKALREACVEVIKVRDEHSKFVELVECMKLKGDTFIWSMEVVYPLHLASDDADIGNSPYRDLWHLIEKHFPENSHALNWGLEENFSVVSSTSFAPFLKSVFERKADLAIVLNATVQFHMDRAKKFEAGSKYAESEASLMNAAMSKVIVENLNTSLSVDDLLSFSDLSQNILERMDSFWKQNLRPVDWDEGKEVSGEGEGIARCYVEAIRNACVEVITTRADHEIFLKFVESLKVSDGRLQFKSEVSEPLVLNSA